MSPPDVKALCRSPGRKAGPNQVPPPKPLPLLLKPTSVARELEIGIRTFWRWVSEGRFPQPDFRPNERVLRWKRSTVEKWVEDNATEGG